MWHEAVKKGSDNCSEPQLYRPGRGKNVMMNLQDPQPPWSQLPLVSQFTKPCLDDFGEGPTLCFQWKLPRSILQDEFPQLEVPHFHDRRVTSRIPIFDGKIHSLNAVPPKNFTLRHLSLLMECFAGKSLRETIVSTPRMWFSCRFSLQPIQRYPKWLSQKQKLFVSADQILGVLVVTRFQILEWNQHMFQVFEAFLRPPWRG